MNFNRTLVMPLIFVIFLFSMAIPINALDISQLMSEKYSLQVEEKNFDVYYGFKGSLEVNISDLEVDNPIISNMFLNKEKKSIEITFAEHEYAGPAWVRLPTELISAEGGEFQLFIEDIEKPYELTYYADDISVGFFMQEGNQQVVIVGTNVIPEFSTVAVLVLGIAMISLIILKRKFNFTSYPISSRRI